MAADPDLRRIPRNAVQVSHNSHDGAISVVVTLDGQVRDPLRVRVS